MPRISRPEKRRIALEKEKIERIKREWESERERERQREEYFFRQRQEYGTHNHGHKHHYQASDEYDESDAEDSDDDINDFLRFFFGSRKFFFRSHFHGSSGGKSSTEESWKSKDFYKTLGIEKNSSIEEVKKAYKEKVTIN